MTKLQILAMRAAGAVALAGMVTLASCQPGEDAGSSATEQVEISTRNVPLIQSDGLEFRDLNRSGTLDDYEDWRKPVERRVSDLLQRMTPEEKAGVMMHSTLRGAAGPLAGIGMSEAGYDIDAARGEIVGKHITSFITRLALAPLSMVEQSNAIQEVAEGGRLGIPVTISTDPRNHFSPVAGASVASHGFSQWPGPLGFAALGDPRLVERFAHIARREYRAVGIHQALSPQADLATEPRWPRADGTFGSDPQTARELVRAYVSGFQGGSDGLTEDGVMTVVKHWVGYGAEPGGWDAHNYYGRFAVLDNDSFALHVEPFKGAFEAGVSGVMPAYTITRGVTIDGTAPEPVGAGYSSTLLRALLRDTHGFDGVILSDWGITRDCPQDTCRRPVEFQAPASIAMPWGVEDLPMYERFVLAIEAGIDQFGGVGDVEFIQQALANDDLTINRLDESVRRIMRVKFQLGLFDNPFVDPSAIEDVFDSPQASQEARSAQARSQVLLKTDRDLLPLAAGTRVYASGVADEAILAAGFEPVSGPEQADVLLLRLSAPHDDSLHGNYFFGSRQAEGRLEFVDGDADYAQLKSLQGGAPVIVSVYLDRPAVLTNVLPLADAIVANFGVSDEALLDVLAGRSAAEGRLPFELPSSDAAVDDQDPAVPDDSAQPLFERGFGIPQADDWVTLFDGQSLSGWRSFKGESPPAGWVVEDGALVLAEPGSGDIVTAAEFGDFELEFDWRISANGNSGVFYFVNETDDSEFTYETGPEYQVLDNDGHPDGEFPNHRAGALYDLIVPPDDVARPVGEYNQGRIVVKEGRIEHWLNGVLTAESPYGDDEWRSMVAASKFSTMPGFGVHASGHIALQDHGDKVWYRNIRIRER